MLVRGLVGLLGGTAVLLASAWAQAQCTKDTDCKGDRVCTAGACVSPASSVDAGPATPPAAPASARKGAVLDQRALGFSNLVFRLERGDAIGIAGEDFRVHILEELRRRQLHAVGAENLVFGNDQSGAAELILGGTVNELDCAPGSSAGTVSCNMGVEWQVLDRASDSVIYKVTTRRGVTDVVKEPAIGVGRQLVLANLGSLTSRARFKDLLVPEPAPAAVSGGYAAATLRACNAPARTMPAASEQVLDATVVIQTGAGFGSGFVVSPDGFVLTAAHVVGGSSATVRLRDGRELPAAVVRSDRRLDVALLRVAVPQGLELTCLPMALGPAAVGSDAYAIGAPTRRELSFSLARGIVSGIRLLDGVQFLQTDAAVNSGNSGGPLVNAGGEAVGIVSAKLVGQSVEGIAFGVPLKPGLDAIAVSPGGPATSNALLTAVPSAAPPAREAFVDRPDEKTDIVNSDAPQQRRRHSTGMLVGGVVMVSLAPVALVVSLVARSQKNYCDGDDYFDGSGSSYGSDCGRYDKAIYGGLLTATALAAIGIPLIVIGGKKKPVATAHVTPWATARAAGVGVRLDL